MRARFYTPDDPPPGHGSSFMAAGLLLNIGQNRPLVMANDAFEFE